MHLAGDLLLATDQEKKWVDTRNKVLNQLLYLFFFFSLIIQLRNIIVCVKITSQIQMIMVFRIHKPDICLLQYLHQLISVNEMEEVLNVLLAPM